jgi:hypothetical protein
MILKLELMKLNKRISQIVTIILVGLGLYLWLLFRVYAREGVWSFNVLTSERGKLYFLIFIIVAIIVIGKEILPAKFCYRKLPV